MPRIETSFYVRSAKACDQYLFLDECRRVSVIAESNDGFNIEFVADRGDSPMPGDEVTVTLSWGDDE